MLAGMSSLPPPRVVAAVSSEAQPRINAILSGWELRYVGSGSELVKALDEAAWDMMIVEVHSNRDAAAAALTCVRSREASFPVVCVCEAAFAMPRHAAVDALGAIGTDAFIDLRKYPADGAGNDAVRTILEGLLPVLV
jgi:hypothetical protein